MKSDVFEYKTTAVMLKEKTTIISAMEKIIVFILKLFFFKNILTPLSVIFRPVI